MRSARAGASATCTGSAGAAPLVVVSAGAGSSVCGSRIPSSTIVCQDVSERYVLLFEGDWELRFAEERVPELQLESLITGAPTPPALSEGVGPVRMERSPA